MKVTNQSMLTKKWHTMEVDITPKQLYEVEKKEKLIQDIVPHLSLDQREFLMTGITPEEWKNTFGEE